MSLRDAFQRQHNGGKIVVDSKSIADYAARIVREHGSALSQSKNCDGGWELSISAGALRRRKYLQRKQ